MYPREGFRPTTRHLVGGLHASSSPCGIALFHERVLPNGGFCPVGVRGYGSPLSKPEALTHTAFIPGGLERDCSAGGVPRLGGTAASSPSFGTSPGRSVRGRITPARTGGHVRPASTAMRDGPMGDTSIDTKPAGQRAVVGGAFDALLPRLTSWVSAIFNR